MLCGFNVVRFSSYGTTKEADFASGSPFSVLQGRALVGVSGLFLFLVVSSCFWLKCRVFNQLFNPKVVVLVIQMLL